MPTDRIRVGGTCRLSGSVGPDLRSAQGRHRRVRDDDTFGSLAAAVVAAIWRGDVSPLMDSKRLARTTLASWRRASLTPQSGPRPSSQNDIENRSAGNPELARS